MTGETVRRHELRSHQGLQYNIRGTALERLVHSARTRLAAAAVGAKPLPRMIADEVRLLGPRRDGIVKWGEFSFPGENMRPDVAGPVTTVASGPERPNQSRRG
jgi:hypothetical protein